jgi:FdhE protein
MPRTAGGLRTDTTSRLSQLEQQRPEWQAWIRLLAIAEQASQDDDSSTAPDDPDLTPGSSGSADDTPLLHRRSLHADLSGIHRLVERLAAVTISESVEGGTSLHQYRLSEAEALDLVSAALVLDNDGLQTLAEERNLDPGALATVAHLAAYPLLQSCGRQLESGISPSWQHGYCPVCAAWPILAERRGLDRSRRLRCGRCSTQWEVPWLYCIYCGERNHERLGTLEAEGQGEVLKVETCATCKGYLKSIATLQGFPAFELLLQDLETVEFDLVALDRGFVRPRDRGFALELRIVDRASRRTL